MDARKSQAGISFDILTSSRVDIPSSESMDGPKVHVV